jgi:biopolymer transport protein ExbD
MGAQLGTAQSFNDMNLTPLIDIVLVVLIIMMVNIPIQVEEMGVKLPSNQEVPPPPPDQPPPEQLVIAVYENGDLALNRRLMKEDILFYEVTRRLRPMDKKNVFIDAHGDIAYGRIIDMVDLAREAGADKVGFAKLKELGPVAATSIHPGTQPRGVILGNPTPVGALSAEEADARIRPLMGRFEACYNTALATAPSLSGRVLLQVAVGPEGLPMSDPTITQSEWTDGDGSVLEPCIAEQSKAILFTNKPPGPGKTAIVRYPLLFSPG